MNKQSLVLLSVICLGLIGIIAIKKITKKNDTRWTVAILQTASHPALNAVKDSFIQKLSDGLNNDVSIIVQNAEGAINSLQSMAQSLHADSDIDLIFAIATPAAQSIVTLEKKKPIVFAAVTDPQTAGLIKPTITNLTGVTDMIDVAQQINLVTTLLPNIKTVGLLFNRGESNATYIAKQMQELLAKHNIKTIDFGIVNESEISAAVEAACRKTDLILAPTDNSVASAITLITSVAHRMGKPVIVSDNMLVARGALAAQGVNYAECGKQAAEQAIAILKDCKQPSELPIINATSNAVINKAEAVKLHIVIPAALHNVELIQ